MTELFNFDQNTDENVQRVLTAAYHNKNRIRIVYGEHNTNTDWLEEHDVIGTVGRSTGNKPCALLISNSRSMGGSAILTNCIVKIVDVKTKRVLWQHPNYTKPILVKCASQHDDFMYDVYHTRESENILHARFKTEKQADNYIGFMHCRRMSK